MSTSINRAEIVRFIDHTLLKPQATVAQVEQICNEALEYEFAAVCVNPNHARFVAGKLAGSNVAVCCVAGFPLGAHLTGVKVYEAQQAIADGANEIDIVIDIGALKNGNLEHVKADIAAVVAACHAGGALLKVIIETVLLTDAEKVTACQLAQAAGTDFVKTSTGFAGGGATVEDVRLMRKTVGPDLGVKAAGGIRTYADALAMIDAGATRIGASAGVRIAEQAPA